MSESVWGSDVVKSIEKESSGAAVETGFAERILFLAIKFSQPVARMKKLFSSTRLEMMIAKSQPFLRRVPSGTHSTPIERPA